MTTLAVVDAPVPSGAPVISVAAHRPTGRAVLTVAVLAVVAVGILTNGSELLAAVSTAIGAAAGASPLWLSLALVLAMTSMLAFAGLRSSLLRSAGAAIPLRASLSIAYSAGAVHLSIPAGAVVAAGHTFRRLRAEQVRPAAAAWSMAVGGVLSSVALTAIGVAGLLDSSGSSALTTGVRALAGVGAAAVAFRWYARHPGTVDRLVQQTLIRWNRSVRRADDHGLATVRASLDDLRSVRATGSGWAVAGAAALVNWTFDLLCLAACAAAVGVPINPLTILVGYSAAMAAGGLSPWPAGLGVLDAALVLTLTTAGLAAPQALGAVLLYRLIAQGHVLVAGWSAVATRSSYRRPAARGRWSA